MPKTIPFDPARRDINGKRKAMRKRLLRWAIIPGSLAVLVGLYLMTPAFITHTAMGRYDTSEFEGAAATFQPLVIFNFVEPYKAHYNQGTALLQDGQYDKAISALDTAYAYAGNTDQACRVIINLTLAYEARGDASMKEKKFSAAIADYVKALSYVRSNPDCFKDSPIGPRIMGKLDEASSAESGEDETERDETKESDEPSDQQQEDLKEQQDRAQQQRIESAKRKSDRENTGNIGNDQKKPW